MDELGIEMAKSEVAYSVDEALSKLPLEGTVLISVNQKDIPEVADIARIFAEDGFHIVATGRTYETIHAAGIPAQKVNKLYEGRPHILDLITNGKHSTATEIHYMKQNNCREVHSLQELHALIQPK